MPADSTPLMGQYRTIKQAHPDCILLFRVGDFYETFYEDAVEVASILNIALTTRDKKKENPVPLAGVPFHAAENYITRLLAAGKKVAVCEQVEDPAKAKGLVKREVVEVLTPGTALSPQLLRDREYNYCMTIRADDSGAAVALIDVSTGDLLCGFERLNSLHYLLQGMHVREVLCDREYSGDAYNALMSMLGNPFVTVQPEYFQPSRIEPALDTQFGPRKGDLEEQLTPLERAVAGALLHHCQTLRGGALPQVSGVGKLAPVSFLALDDETIINLELFEPLRGGHPKATLIRCIDRTLTPMGGRTIRDWLQKPLASAPHIEQRLDAVSDIYGNQTLHEALAVGLKRIADIRRLATRIAARKAIPRELHALKDSLNGIPGVRSTMEDASAPLLASLTAQIGDHATLAETIESAVVPDPPGHLRDGGVINRGYSEELDALMEQNDEAKTWIANLERSEREATGIGSLKVGYNKVFGYYIEVSRTHLDSVPEHYITKQTLVNSQRYYTAELKEREESILRAEERRIECEQRVFDELCEIVSREIPALQKSADALARIDVLQGLAAVARTHSYKRPEIDDSRSLEIQGGRHPVLEQFIKEPFVPNDLGLDPERRQFALITGPNMSGKSTFLRQIALIVILAQMGSFVPADRARIGIIDKVFTRVGASDRLSRGQSTFLVEMDETAHILELMTDRSLVLLDEIGRGTSTFDGLSIAWAVTEYILQGANARPKALFATHFHELTQLKENYPRLLNLKITIREWEGGIIFLRKIVPGTSERSYGIHAARVAGLPPQILKRAEEILQSLELRRDLLHKGVDLARRDLPQMDMFSQAIMNKDDTSHASTNTLSIIKKMLDSYDIDSSTPLEALQFIKELKTRLSSPDS